MESPKQQYNQPPVVERQPIEETKESISYLGARLEKAKNTEGGFVPERDKLESFFVNDKYALELQQKVAIALGLGQNLLIEGGTAIGKTTTIAKMCAELGYELHYVNLNGQTDVENLMGRYIPNIRRKKETDPEYEFSDGSVTKGLRREEGKIKLILLDEVNATHPGTLKRLNEVLNAVEQGGTVVLTEDAAEQIQVSKETTKVVALMNPSGQGYLGVNPLSKELINRFVYQKEANELPRESFGFRRKAKRGIGVKTEKMPDLAFIHTSEGILSMEQYNEIPGIEEIEAKFEEFHFGAKELLKQRKLAEDQTQLFLYDDQRESDRVTDYIRRHYNGDINDTFQQALKYYYSNKLETDTDRKKLGELIRLVEYKPKTTESKRKGTEREEKTSGAPEAEGVETLESKEGREIAEKITQRLEELLTEGADKNEVAQGLSGVGTSEAMALRERLLTEGANKNQVARGLAGVGTPEAMALRERLLTEGADKNQVAYGLSGVGTPEAMALRERLLTEGADKNQVAYGLSGVGTPEAMALRERLLTEGANKNYVAWGLAGVGTSEAMALRERLLTEGANKNEVARGLAGVGTSEAMALRERLLTEGANKNQVARGLAGVGTPEAMALRERLLKEGADKNEVARGLAGVNNEEAFAFREKFFGEDSTLAAKSFHTGWSVTNGVVCRYGYEGGVTETVKGVSIPETKLEGPVAEQIEAAIEKLGKENVFGPNEVEKTFGVRLAEVPDIPFSVEELERAEKMGQMLVLRVDKTAEGKPMSLEAMNVAVMERWQKEGKGALLSTPDGWENFIKESYKKDVPRSGWALVSREILSESLGKNYIEQTDVIIKTLKDKVFKGMEIPEKYAKAMAEFESQKERLTKLMNDDWQEAVKQLSALEITQMTRQTIQETIYDLAMYYDTNNKHLLTDKYTWSASVSPVGTLVDLGGFGDGGVNGGRWRPVDRDDDVGVSFSRRL